MPLSYGKTAILPKQQYKFAPIKNTDNKKRVNTSLFRILVTVFEIAATLIPGIGPVAATAIGLGAAGTNIAISKYGRYGDWKGEASPVTALIDISTAFLPTIGMFRTAGKIGRATTGEFAQQVERGVLSSTQAESDVLFSNFTRTASVTGNKISRANRQLTKLNNDAINSAMGRLRGMSQRLQRGELAGREAAAMEYIAKAKEAKLAIRENNKIMNDALLHWRVSERELRNQIEEWEEIFEQVKNIKWTKRITQNKFVAELEQLGGAERLSTLKEIYLGGLGVKSKSVAYKAERAMTRIRIEKKAAQLSKYGQKKVKLFIARLRYQKLTQREIAEEFDLLMRTFETNKRDFKIVNSIFNNEKQVNELMIFATDYGPAGDRFRKGVRYIGSRKFNDKVVQPMQAIFDPNDLGRWGPERAYQFFKEKINNRVFKKQLKKAEKAMAKGIEKSEGDFDKAFEAAGGKLLKSRAKPGQTVPLVSRYITGIKWLGGTDLKGMVLVKFNKANTQGSGANKNGKRDLIVSMSKVDFDRLAFSGTEYWFSVGRKKGWFVSRGGRRTGEQFASISNRLSLFLGFVPIPALRNMLSIVSNMVENIADMAKGNYISTYAARLERAFVRSSINRTARLVTRTSIGSRYEAKAMAKAEAYEKQQFEKGIIKTTKLGNQRELNSVINEAMRDARMSKRWLGRELQRFSTVTLSSFEGKDKSGMFKFKSPETRTGSAIGNLSKKMVVSGFGQSVRSAGIRTSRRRGGNYGRNLVGTQRKFQQLTRVYSAVTPSGVKQLRSFGKF